MNGTKNFIYRFKDILRIISVIVGLIIIILLTPIKQEHDSFKEKDLELELDIKENSTRVENLSSNQAVLKAKCSTLEKNLKSIREDIRWLVRQQGGTPSN